MSAAPSGVVQRIEGRPELEEKAGLPAPSSRTKRFISSTRAAGVRREKDSALRAVRTCSKRVSSWAQAAARRSRRATEGASDAGAGAGDAAFGTVTIEPPVRE